MQNDLVGQSLVRNHLDPRLVSNLRPRGVRFDPLRPCQLILYVLVTVPAFQMLAMGLFLLGGMIRPSGRIRYILPMVFLRKYTAGVEKVAFSVDAGAQCNFDILGEEFHERTAAI